MMGRPRTTQHKRRQPISVSLPKGLIEQWDKSLKPNQSRSRHIESLLKRELTPTVQNALGNHAEYYCKKCNLVFEALPIKCRVRGLRHPAERVCKQCDSFAIRKDISDWGDQR
jgi:NAD-dependent SIR2 family protein deacetylase